MFLRLFVDINHECPDGRCERIRKRSPVQTVRGAENYERQVRQSLLEGTFHTEKVVAAVSVVPTVAEFMIKVREAWTARRLKHSTVTTYEDIYKRHLEEPFGDLPLDQIDNARKQAALAALHGLSVRRTNNIICVLSSIFRVAVELGVIEKAPCQLKMLKVTKPDVKFFG